MSNKTINYDNEEEYEDDFFEESEEEEEENEEENEADNVDIEVEEENVEEEIVEEEDEIEEIEETNEDDSGIGIEEIMEEKIVNTRKREFNIDREKIKKQLNSFKFFNSENVNTTLKPIVEGFTSSEKNINIILNNITSKKDKIKMLNISRFMYYKDLNLKDMLTSIKEDTYSFNNILWDKQREEIKKEVNRLQTKIEVMESYIECPKCKQKKIQFYNVQLRRADEPPTTFNNCMNKDCMHTWRTG
jgi:DNA-directed RNA polymerase subunit M/transcription elongation factor TFIIS